MEKIHIGRLINSRLKELGMTKAELARRINLKSQAIIPMLKKSSINTDQLSRISDAMGYDFFKHFSVNPSLVMEGTAEYKVKPKQESSVSISISINDPDKEEKIFRMLGLELK